jgi:hypothetical protein
MTDEQSKHNRAKFEKVWHDEVTRVEILKNKLPLNSKKRASLRPSLHRALLKDFIITTWIVQPLMFASSTARIVMSISLGYLIQSFIDKSKEGYWWAAILVFCNAVVLFEHHHVFFFTVRFQCNYLMNRLFESNIFHLHSGGKECSFELEQSPQYLQNL